jgi:putative FmdB family regulatory protein
MPIYEYQCEKCGEVFEVFQRVSDPPPEQHECGGRKIKRVMSQTSFILKGSGWYITDYARKEQAQKERHGKSESTKSQSAKESKKKESKKDSSSKGSSSKGSGSKGSGGDTKAAA